MNKIKAFLREHRFAILVVVLLVTPAVSWAWTVIAIVWVLQQVGQPLFPLSALH